MPESLSLLPCPFCQVIPIFTEHVTPFGITTVKDGGWDYLVRFCTVVVELGCINQHPQNLHNAFSFRRSADLDGKLTIDKIKSRLAFLWNRRAAEGEEPSQMYNMQLQIDHLKKEQNPWMNDY